MYLPRHFEESRVAALHRLIEERPLGTLVTLADGALDANHVPFEIDPEPAPFGTLRAHVARANPVRKALPADALVVFQGADAYVSPALLPSKRADARVVPTWNYVVVHAHGTLSAVEDPAWLRAFVERLTRRHERGRADPWQVTDAPDDYVEKMLRGIVGLELPVQRLVGKWKLSQNRTEQDRLGVADGMPSDERGAVIARLVRETLG